MFRGAQQASPLLEVAVAKTLPRKRGGFPKLKVLFAAKPTYWPSGQVKNGVLSIYVPLLDISYPLTNTMLSWTTLPDMRKSSTGTKICMMVTPMLRGSTFYIRGDHKAYSDKGSANPPEVCHVQVGSALPANKALSVDLYQTSSQDNLAQLQTQGPTRSEVGQQQEGEWG
jgi:hypothetical protein